MSVACSLIKTTLVDYPERVAAACFLSGCNLRCPYCYNAELVEPCHLNQVESCHLDQRGEVSCKDVSTALDMTNVSSGGTTETSTTYPLHPTSYNEIIAHLEKRRNVLTGFVISGGEPLLHYDFTIELIRAARALGYKIKLDTNGILPERLESLLNDAAICPDYIALDVKTSPNRYGELSGKGTVGRVQNSVRRIQDAGDNEILTPYHFSLPPDSPPASASATASVKLVSTLPPESREFRTVLYPPLVGREEIAAIAAILPKDAAWYFAQFRNEHCLSKEAEKIAPYTDEEANKLVDYAKTLIAGAKLR